MSEEEIKNQALSFSKTMEWWDKETLALLNRMNFLAEKEEMSAEEEREFEEVTSKLSYFYKKGINEIKQIDKFISQFEQ